jgi:hypothetical protein
MVECIGNSLIISFQLFLPNDGSGAIAGVIGALRLDVLAGRLQAEYGLSVTLETTASKFARWIAAKNPAERDSFIHAHPAPMAHALDAAPAFMAASVFDLKYDQDTCPEIIFPDSRIISAIPPDGCQARIRVGDLMIGNVRNRRPGTAGAPPINLRRIDP